MQCYFCRCISQVQLDGNFPSMGGLFPPRRESLLENVTYVKTKMFEETWLFDNLLLTHLWVSSRELCGFLMLCWCWGAEGLIKSRLRVWPESFGILRPCGFSGMGSRKEKLWAPWLQCEVAYCVTSLAETLKGPRVWPPLYSDPLMTSRTCEIPQSKKTKFFRAGNNQLFCFIQ